MAITGAGSVYLKATPGISPYSQRTIAAWVKMSPTGTSVNLFMGLVGSSFSYQMNLHFAGNPTPNIFGSVCQSQNGTTIDGTASSSSTNAPWHFVLATFDNGGVTGNVQTIKIYTDGVLNGTVTAGGPVTALVDNDPGSSLYVWPGSTDGNAQVAYPMVWKRLLSQGEITALAAQGDPRTVAPAQLVSFVDLNQGSGSIADLVGAGINWVVNGGTLTVVPNPFSLGGGGMAAFDPAMTINTLLGQLVAMDTQHTTELTTTTNVAYYENVMQINWLGGSRVEINVKTMSKTPSGVRLKNPLPRVGP
jgi:Concanavalin A-like lectin/glucanases superfamily